MVAIKDLQDGMKRVSVEAKVVDKGDPREVKSRFKDETYRIVDAVVADETGSVKVTLFSCLLSTVYFSSFNNSFFFWENCNFHLCTGRYCFIIDPLKLWLWF